MRRRRIARTLPVLAAVLLAAGVCACVERGDFGRVKPSVWNDTLASTGTMSALARGEAVSFNALTDDEDEMRGRAWRFLVPAHERAWFDRALADLVAIRIAPPDVFGDNPSVYYGALQSEGARSPASLYRRLSEDASADVHLLGPFASVAQRVLVADGVRLRALGYTHELTASDVENARNRTIENRCLIAWVEWGLETRLRGYRFALEHLVIATPQPDAVPVERALGRLEQHRVVLGRLGVPAVVAAACLGSAVDATTSAPPAAEPVARPLVRKG